MSTSAPDSMASTQEEESHERAGRYRRRKTFAFLGTEFRRPGAGVHRSCEYRGRSSRAAAAYSYPGVSRDSVFVSPVSPNGAGSASRSPNRVLHPASRETRDRSGIRRGSGLGHLRIRGLSMGSLAESLARSRVGALLRIVQSRGVEADPQGSL